MLHRILSTPLVLLLIALPAGIVNAAERNIETPSSVATDMKLKTDTLKKLDSTQSALNKRLMKSVAAQSATRVGKLFTVPLDIKQQAARLVEKNRRKGFIDGMSMVEQVFPEQAAAKRALEDTGDRLYLFISSSVPLVTLRNYARAIDGLPGAVMVLRGFVQGADRLKPTMRLVRKIRLKDKECEGDDCKLRDTAVVVDPVLFRRYKIKRVPALVAAEGVQSPGTCSEGNPDVVNVGASGVIYGDAGVQGLLARLESDGNMAAARYRALLP